MHPTLRNTMIRMQQQRRRERVREASLCSAATGSSRHKKCAFLEEAFLTLHDSDYSTPIAASKDIRVGEDEGADGYDT